MVEVALRTRTRSRIDSFWLRCRLSSCYMRRDVIFNKCGIQRKKRHVGYHCTQHCNKYRVSPRGPMCWAPYKELYQQVRERPPQEGATAVSPHGSTGVDIETYEALPNNAVKVRGTMTFLLGTNAFVSYSLWRLWASALSSAFYREGFDAIIRP